MNANNIIFDNNSSLSNKLVEHRFYRVQPKRFVKEWPFSLIQVQFIYNVDDNQQVKDIEEVKYIGYDIVKAETFDICYNPYDRWAMSCTDYEECSADESLKFYEDRWKAVEKILSNEFKIEHKSDIEFTDKKQAAYKLGVII